MMIVNLKDLKWFNKRVSAVDLLFIFIKIYDIHKLGAAKGSAFNADYECYGSDVTPLYKNRPQVYDKGTQFSEY